MEDQITYKIYRLFGAGMSYYGSTHQPIYERKSQHKTAHKNKLVCCSSKLILDSCDDWDVEIVELLPNSTREQALLREKWWIDNNDCVNINSPISKTTEEMKEYQRLWAEKSRREKGVPVKEKIKTVEEKKYKREKAREYRAQWTDEERAEINRKNRESRPIQTEEQKEKARKRARKQQSDIKANPSEVEKKNEYQRLRAEKKRREQGIQPQAKRKTADMKKYQREFAKAKRDSLTPEELAEVNRKQQERRKALKQKKQAEAAH